MKEKENFELQHRIKVLERALELCIGEYLYWLYLDTSNLLAKKLAEEHKDEEYLRFISQAEKELEGKQ